jgi:hypothetical protein
MLLIVFRKDLYSYLQNIIIKKIKKRSKSRKRKRNPIFQPYNEYDYGEETQSIIGIN